MSLAIDKHYPVALTVDDQDIFSAKRAGDGHRDRMGHHKRRGNEVRGDLPAKCRVFDPVKLKKLQRKRHQYESKGKASVMDFGCHIIRRPEPVGAFMERLSAVQADQCQAMVEREEGI
jgi:hypothetical protein